MRRDLTWQATRYLTRAQLELFHVMGDQIGLTQDDRRRALDLDHRAWSAWTGFLTDGPLPAEPPLPAMLQRLAETAFNLSVVAQQRAA